MNIAKLTRSNTVLASAPLPSSQKKAAGWCMRRVRVCRVAKHIPLVLLMFFLFSRLQAPAWAQMLETWTPSPSDPQGLWSNGGNWNPPTNSGGPSGNFNIVIPHYNQQPSPTLDVSASIVNLQIDANAALYMNSELTITGATIANNGQLVIGNGAAGTLNISDVVTLSGSGNVFMGPGGASVSGGGTLINQQLFIQADGGTISAALNNQSPNGEIRGGTPSNPLFITGAVTNSGTIHGLGFSTVELQGNTINNAGGVIDASSGQMLLNNCTISGGTIGSATSVPVAAADHAGLKSRTHEQKKAGHSQAVPPAAPTGEPTLNGVTVTGVYSVQSDASHTNGTTLEGNITNNGQIAVTSPPNEQAAVLYIPGAVTLSGTGTLSVNGQNASISGPGTLTNNSIIQGGGGSMSVSDLINDDEVEGPILLTLEAISNASGTLNAEFAPITINGGSVQGGQILANGSNSGVTLSGGVIVSGVVFTGSGGGIVTVINAILDGLTNPDTIQLILQIDDNGVLILEGGVIILTPGEIFLDASSFTASLIIEDSVGVSGTGQMVMGNSPNNKVSGNTGTKNALTITIPTLNASGTIGDGTFPITIGAKTTVTNGGYPLIFNVGKNSFKNLGTLVEGDSTIEIVGKFANYNSTTNMLTGGTYMLNGVLQFQNANLVNNASKLILTGNGQVQNQNGANGLVNFSNNMAKGTFELTGGQNFETTGTFNNEGAVIIGSGSSFRVGGSSTNYVQSGATAVTTVDGGLIVPAGGLTNITGGTLQGAGQFAGDVSVGNASGGAAATLIVGNSKKSAGQVTMQNKYTQLATGAMDVQIGGTTPGSKYSQLNVTDAVNLSGTLNIADVNKFKPTVGQVFTILNGASGVTGSFSTINGTSINSNEHYAVAENSTDVTLTVESGP